MEQSSEILDKNKAMCEYLSVLGLAASSTAAVFQRKIQKSYFGPFSVKRDSVTNKKESD